MEELPNVLAALLQPEAAVRKQAEAYIENAKQAPEALVGGLMAVAQGPLEEHLRQLSVVILRRFLSRTSESLWEKLSPDFQAKVRGALLDLLGQGTAAALLSAVAHCCVGLAIRHVDQNGWPELLPRLQSLIKGGSANEQRCALVVLGGLAAHMDDKVMASTYVALKDSYGHAATSGKTLPVRVAAVEAAMLTITHLDVKQQIDTFRSILPQLVQVVGQALSEDPELACKAFEAFIGLAEISSDYFSKHLKDVFAPFLQVASSETLDDSLRQLALEFTLTCAENDPRSVKRLPNFVQTIVPLALKMQVDIEDDAQWNVTAEEEDDEVVCYDIGVEAMDRIALALDAKVVYSVTSPLVMQFLQRQEWQYRHAALISVGQIAEGCSKEIKPHLAQVSNLVAKHFEDPHPRVRFAAVTCMAQLATEFSPKFQTQFHGLFLPRIIALVGDATPKVAVNAAKGMINFIEGATPADTQAYLDQILTALLQLLERSEHRFVREDVVTAISAVAQHSEELFGKYYDTIMPWLKTVIGAQNVPKTDRLLRAKAIECLSRVALAVGKQRFAADIPFILPAMRAIQSTPMEADDPQVPYLVQAWARIAKCMEADFTPYLDAVIPPLMAAISVNTDVTISDEVDETDDTIQSVTIALPGVGDKKVSVRTSALEEKALGCAALADHMEACGNAMLPWMEPLVPLMGSLLKFPYMEDVREDSARLLPCIVKCLATNKPDAVPSVVQHLVKELFEAIKLEPERGVMATQFKNLSGMIEAAPAGSVGMGMLQIAAASKKRLVEGLQCRKNIELQKQATDDDRELEELDEELETEEDTINEAVDVLTALLKAEPQFQPHFERSFLPDFMDLVTVGKHSAFEARLGLCVLASYMESHGTTQAQAHVATIVQALLHYCVVKGNEADLVQVAAWGLGAGFQHAGAAFQPFVQDAVKRLTAVVASKAGDEDWEDCVCNAVSALFLAAEFNHQQPSAAPEAVMPTILKGLPVKGDEEQAQIVNRKFVGLVTKGDPLVMGPNNANLPSICGVLKSFAGTSLADSETKAEAARLLASVGN